ncbi:hypothetical protein [Microbacterium oxydans]|uniref:hypothetical protein n=1 Tax=Microbacterium oxydans TaxID=82380 RepID=UPI0036714B47
MADTTPGGYTDSDPAPAERWWTTGYAVRLAFALLLAGAFTGAILGPAGLLLGQLHAALAGSTLTYPAWMYGQAATIQAFLGLVIGGGISLAMVLLLPRPRSPFRLLLRIIAGPLVAGGLLLALSVLFFRGGGMLSIVLQTTFGCAVFMLAGALSRTSKLDQIEPLAE